MSFIGSFWLMSFTRIQKHKNINTLNQQLLFVVPLRIYKTSKLYQLKQMTNNTWVDGSVYLFCLELNTISKTSSLSFTFPYFAFKADLYSNIRYQFGIIVSNLVNTIYTNTLAVYNNQYTKNNGYNCILNPVIVTSVMSDNQRFS